VDRAAPS